MNFERYCVIPTVLELNSGEKTDALSELATAACKVLAIESTKEVIDEMLKREENSSTFVGQGVALPQTKAPLESEFAIVVGRSTLGIPYDAARNALAQIIILLIARQDADPNSQITVLSELAAAFKSEQAREQILNAQSPISLIEIFANLRTGTPEETVVLKEKKKSAAPIITSAMTLARETKAAAIMVFADSVRDNDFLDQIRNRNKIIIVTSNKTRFEHRRDKRIQGIIQAPPIPTSRTGQIKIGILLALSRNLIRRDDWVVCVSGNSRSNVFDTLVTVDVALEYEFFFVTSQDLLPPDVKPEVLERIIGLAGEIAVEGREGRPTGTVFVLGDTNSVNKFVRQLIINPFRGYSEAERNIMDPGLVETIKEFSSIDGAFIVTGDGIVLSAGSYLRPQLSTKDLELLPGGFGARHAAASAITACTNALAITISESTGMVTLFKGGSIMMSLSRPVVRDKQNVQKFGSFQ